MKLFACSVCKTFKYISLSRVAIESQLVISIWCFDFRVEIDGLFGPRWCSNLILGHVSLAYQIKFIAFLARLFGFLIKV